MNKSIKPTDGELEILNILWTKGPSSVREVHEQLNKDAGYTTTLKLMQIMLEKGLLKRDAGSKVHVYEAAVSQKKTQGYLLNRMIETAFDGSAMSLVMEALGNYKASSAEMEQIREYLDSAEKAANSKKLK
jgi:predicted transcriptional regulator